MNELLNALVDDNDCDTQQLQIEAYAAAQITGDAYDGTFWHVQRHLDRCVDCAELYAERYDEILYANAPKADLSFLKQEPSLVQRLREQMTQWQGRVQLQLSAELQALLTPLPTLATVRRTSGDKMMLLLHLSSAQTSPHSQATPFSIKIYKKLQNQEMGVVMVKVEPPDKSWPMLSGYTVELKTTSFTQTQESDPHGEVVIASVPLTELDTLTVTIVAPTV